jgi:hypothetical protein
MKIVTAAGKKKVVMTRKEWEAIGKKAGWDKKKPVDQPDDEDDDAGCGPCPICSSDETACEGHHPGEITCRDCGYKWFKKAIEKKAGWSMDDGAEATDRARRVQANHPELANFIPYVVNVLGNFEPYLIDNMSSIRYMKAKPPVLYRKELEEGVVALAHPDSFK